MNKAFTILTILSFITTKTVAQSLSQSLISVAGDFNDKNASLSWTLGETSIETHKESFHLTEGFQQGLLNLLYKDSLQFDAFRLNDEQAFITWRMENELNSDGYIIQRKIKGEANFQDIIYIKSKGAKLKNIVYGIEDPNAFYVPSYYRLKHILQNGSEFFTTIKVIEGIRLIKAVNVFPNPTTKSLNITFETKNLEKETTVNLQVLDMLGRKALADKEVKLFNTTSFQLNEVQQLANGTYVLIATISNKIIGQFKFVKL